MAAEGKADQDEDSDHIDLHHNSHSRNPLISIWKQEAVHKGDTEALHEICDRGRKADGQDLADLSGGDMKTGRIDGQLPALGHKEPDKEKIGTDISKHRGDRGACRSQTEHRYEDRIQYDIDDGSQYGSRHGGCGEAFRPQQVGGRKGQDDKRGTQHDKGIILRNIGIRILVGTQQVKNRMPE